MAEKRDVIVGLFVVVGLALLAVLIIWFEGVSGVLRGGYVVRVKLPNARGITEGKQVHRDGVRIGDVSAIESCLPEPGVVVVLSIDPGERIAGKAQFVVQTSAVGDLYLDFRTPSDLKRVETYLPTDGSARVQGGIKPPSLLPEKWMEKIEEGMAQIGSLKEIVKNVQELTQRRTVEDVEAGQAPNLSSAIEQFSRTAAAYEDQTRKDDPKTFLNLAAQAAEDLIETLEYARGTMADVEKTLKTYQEAGSDVKATLKSIRETAGTYQDVGTKASAMLDKIGTEVDRAEEMIAKLSGIVSGIEKGEGTVGKLLTDDELHRALVTLVENLTAATDDIRRLVTLWREEGIMAKEGD